MIKSDIKVNDNSETEANYLKKDLFKIITISSLALGFQLVLYFLSVNKIINLQKF